MKKSHAKFLIGALLIGGLITSSASAATVNFILDLTGAPGTFTLKAAASAGDSGGIASYGVPLTGPILTLDHRAPYAVNQANFAPAGFSNLRSADGVANVFAGQPLSGPAGNYLYGIGQTPGSFVSAGITPIGFPDLTSDAAWLAPVVIATGTYNPADGGRPDFLPPTADLFSNLYAQPGNSTDKISATVSTQVIAGGNPPVVNLVDIGERELSAGTIVQAFSATNGPNVWTGLTQTLGPAPAIAPVLLADGTFTWNPAGSLAGKKGSGQVVYQWAATATNGSGFDTDPAFQVTLIPEPATVSLLGLALVGAFGYIRRR